MQTRSPFLAGLTRRLLPAALGIAAVAPAVAQGVGIAVSDCELRIAGGPSGKVYELMIRDLQAVCGDVVRTCAVASTGGLQNLSLIAANEAELGIVQIDTLRDMRQGDDESLRALQAVLPLHANLLHVLTLAEGSVVDTKTMPLVGRLPFTGDRVAFRQVSQLRGRTIVAVGSAQLLAQALESHYRLGLDVRVADTDDDALRLLRAGKAQAVFTLGGWPLPVVAQQGADSGLMLADFDLAPNAPYTLATRSYQKLAAFNLRFLAAPNVLVTRPFRPDGAAWRRVARLQRCVAEQLDTLQEGRYQPAWREIRDVGATYGVQPFGSGMNESTRPEQAAARQSSSTR